MRQVKKKKSPLPILLNIHCSVLVFLCVLVWFVVGWFFPPILFKGDVDGKDIFKICFIN